MRLIRYFFFTFLFAACSSNRLPNGILSAAKMEKIIKDMMQIDEYLIENVKTDSGTNIKMKRSIYYQQIFDLNKTNNKEFYSSYKYYQQHPDLHKALFDTLAQRFASDKNDTTHKQLFK